ncbi:MAG: hypothetical protein PHF86_10710 [Candidatus Nanoarchaeia archaeon]|nr:hypothetical protein [Candidatus Nanoarchaeia archaeon]
MKTGNFDKRDLSNLDNYLNLILDVCINFVSKESIQPVKEIISTQTKSKPQSKENVIPITSRKYDPIQGYIRELADPKWNKQFKEIEIRGETYIQRLEIMINRLGEFKDYIKKNNFNSTIANSIKNVDSTFKGYLKNIYDLLDRYVETNEILYKEIIDMEGLGDKYALRIRNNISQMQQEIRNLKIDTSHIDLNRFLELIKEKNSSDEIIIKSLEGFQTRLETAKTNLTNAVKYGNIALKDIRLELIGNLQSYSEELKSEAA